MDHDIASLWARPEALDALASRDISAVYALLRRHGMSQAWIAARTGQVQSEVSAILNGRRVTHYDLLVRIADGLNIPRGLMGLAHTGGRAEPSTPRGDDDVRRRAFISLVGSLALGGSATEEQWQHFTPTMDMDVEPFASVVRPDDAKALTALVDAFRASEVRYGGYGKYQAVLSAVRYGESLTSRMDEKARRPILSGIAYCHASAGWFAAEENHLDTARAHCGRALEYARDAADPMMRARALYCAGRIELHFGDPAEATKLFQLGLIGIERSPLMMSVMLSNTAWAAAESGWHDYARRLIQQAREAHDSVQFESDTPMFGWFRTSNFAGVVGAAEIACQDYEAAHSDLTVAIRERPAWEHRSLSFDTANLARTNLLLGDKDAAVSVGQQTLAHASHVRSARLSGRLSPLAEESAKRRGQGSDVSQLAHELQRCVVAARVPA